MGKTLDFLSLILYMKIIILSLSILILCNCQPKKHKYVNKKNEISTVDSIFVEQEILKYKNCLFSEIYHLGIKNSYQKFGYNENNIPKLQDLTYYFYGGEFNPRFMEKDINRDNLIRNWLNDKRYYDIPEIKEGSLDLVRALDFYNSKELEKYLDSLKKNEYERILFEMNN